MQYADERKTLKCEYLLFKFAHLFLKVNDLFIEMHISFIKRYKNGLYLMLVKPGFPINNKSVKLI